MRAHHLLALCLCCSCGPESAEVNAGGPDDGQRGASLQQPSSRPGMGAVVYPQGTTFRTWAPAADAVFVAGDFNHWSTSANPLAREPQGGLFSADVPGAHAGQAYKLIIVHGGKTLWRGDPRAAQAIDAAGNDLIHDPAAYAWSDATFTPAPREKQVIYELHLPTFNETSGPWSGTWASAEARLDHLAALGINLVEVLPVAEFHGKYSWGYNPALLFAPESTYGTPEQMKHFIDQAHARGIGVLIDIVHNHWGSADLPQWCFDGDCLGAGGIYFYTDARITTPFGPRPDYGQSAVADYIADNASMWLDEYHADGLRWDSVVNIRRTSDASSGLALPEGLALLKRVNDSTDKLMIAEDLQRDASLTQPTAQGGAGFDSQWSPSFDGALRGTLSSPEDGRSLTNVAQQIAERFNGRALDRVIFTENHDVVALQNGAGHVRLPALIDPVDPASLKARKLSTLAAALTLTSPGVPMLFMGQEFLEPTPFPFSQSSALDWSNLDRFAGIDALYSDLVHLRTNAAGHTAGLTGNGVQVFHQLDRNQMVAFRRWHAGGPGDDVVVVANLGSHAFTAYQLGFPSGGRWKVRFNSDSHRYGADFPATPSDPVDTVAGSRDGLPFNGAVGIGAQTVVILSQDP